MRHGNKALIIPDLEKAIERIVVAFVTQSTLTETNTARYVMAGKMYFKRYRFCRYQKQLDYLFCKCISSLFLERSIKLCRNILRIHKVNICILSGLSLSHHLYIYIYKSVRYQV